MAKFMLLFCAILFVTSVVLAEEETCSPWLGYCRVYEQCCRGLTCSSYQAKCVPMGGLEIPGRDTRPVGPPPYPPKVQYPPFN